MYLFHRILHQQCGKSEIRFLTYIPSHSLSLSLSHSHSHSLSINGEMQGEKSVQFSETFVSLGRLWLNKNVLCLKIWSFFRKEVFLTLGPVRLYVRILKRLFRHVRMYYCFWPCMVMPVTVRYNLEFHFYLCWSFFQHIGL